MSEYPGYIELYYAGLNYMSPKYLPKYLNIRIDEDKDVIYFLRDGKMIELGTLNQVRERSDEPTQIHDKNGNFIVDISDDDNARFFIKNTRRPNPTQLRPKPPRTKKRLLEEEPAEVEQRQPPSLLQYAFWNMPTSEIKRAKQIIHTGEYGSDEDEPRSGGKQRRKTRKHRKGRKTRKNRHHK